MFPRSVIKLRIKLEHFDESTNRLMIESVRIRPALWDHNRQNIPGIKKTQQKQQSEVAATLNCSVDLFKKKWKNLRKCFFRQLKKIQLSDDEKYLSDPSTLRTDWPYYRLMLFLIDRNDIHPSVRQGGRKLKSKSIKNETKKRSFEEHDAGSSVLPFNESSSSDTVESKKRHLEAGAKSPERPFIKSPSSVTIDLTDEDIDLKSSQVSSTSNLNDLSTGVIQNDGQNEYEADQDEVTPDIQNEYEADQFEVTPVIQNENETDQLEVTPDIPPVINPGLIHIMIGLHHFIDRMEDTEKIQVGTFLRGFAESIINGIEGSRMN